MFTAGSGALPALRHDVRSRASLVRYSARAPPHRPQLLASQGSQHLESPPSLTTTPPVARCARCAQPLDARARFDDTGRPVCDRCGSLRDAQAVADAIPKPLPAVVVAMMSLYQPIKLFSALVRAHDELSTAALLEVASGPTQEVRAMRRGAHMAIGIALVRPIGLLLVGFLAAVLPPPARRPPPRSLERWLVALDTEGFAREEAIAEIERTSRWPSPRDRAVLFAAAAELRGPAAPAASVGAGIIAALGAHGASGTDIEPITRHFVAYDAPARAAALTNLAELHSPASLDALAHLVEAHRSDAVGIELPFEALARHPEASARVVPWLLQLPGTPSAFLRLVEVGSEICTAHPVGGSFARAAPRLRARWAELEAVAELPTAPPSLDAWHTHDLAVVEVAAILGMLVCFEPVEKIRDRTSVGPHASPLVVLAALDAPRSAGLPPDPALVARALSSPLARAEVLARAVDDGQIAALVPASARSDERVAEATVATWFAHPERWGPIVDGVEHVERMTHAGAQYDLVRVRARPTVEHPDPPWLVALHRPVDARASGASPVTTDYATFESDSPAGHLGRLLSL